MAELDMEKDLMEETAELNGDDFGLEGFAIEEESEEEAIAEFASTQIEEEEVVDTKKIAGCFPEWSLDPDEMNNYDDVVPAKKKKK